MYKVFIETLGGYNIYEVDVDEIRNKSKSYKEFTSYGIHSDFKKLIPKEQIWIDRYCPMRNRWYLLEEGVLRNIYESNGLSRSEAYSKALHKIKAVKLRREYAHSTSKFVTIEEVNDCHVRQIEVINKLSVWLVDSSKVNTKFKVDFIEGGHGYVYSFVPIEEIWIDVEVPEKERNYVLSYEMKEMELMKQGIGYNRAHRLASKYVWEIRNVR